LWGMAYGLWYAALAEHQALHGIGLSLTTAFEASAKGDPRTAEAALDNYKDAKYAYDRQVDVHGHWIGLAMLLIVIGIGFDRVRFQEGHKLLLATALLSGAVLFPFGVFLQTSNRGPVPRGLAVLGSALVIAGLAAVTFGLMGGHGSSEEPG